jgi:hypothetical protein
VAVASWTIARTAYSALADMRTLRIVPSAPATMRSALGAGLQQVDHALRLLIKRAV